MTEIEKNELRKAFEQMLEEERRFALVNTFSIVCEGLKCYAMRRRNWTISINFTEEFDS